MSVAEEGAPTPLPMPPQNLLVSEAHSRMNDHGDPDAIPMPVGQIVHKIVHFPRHAVIGAE